LSGSPASVIGSVSATGQLIQAGLTKDLSVEESEKILNKSLESLSSIGGKGLGILGKTAIRGILASEPSTSTAFRTMWESERGRKVARQYVLHEIAFPDAVRLPFLLCVHENIRQQAFAGKLTRDEDELAWRLVESLYALFRSGKANKDILALGLLWQNPTARGIGSHLEFRGPLAYVLGRRSLLKKADPSVARSLFEDALKNAGADQLLQQLAQAGLEEIGKK
jgi:hypothetical protein